jgi:hypothetical protein
MTLLRLLVNAIVGGMLLFAWTNFAPAFLGEPQSYPRDSDAYSFGRTLGAYLADVAVALIAGWLLWLAAPRVSQMRWRVGFVASLGLLSSLVADGPLWRRLENVLGFTLVGLFLAWRMKAYRPGPVPPAPNR